MIVALGYYPGDQELAKKLSAWVRELGQNKGHSVLLARDVRCANDESIKANLEAVFDKVEVINIPEKVDGWKHAPNIVIRSIAVHIENTNPQPWLFIEPDVVPLKEGWVETLAKEYDHHKKPFLGDFVQVKDVIPHMSGVALYPGKVTDHAPDIKFAALSDMPWDVYAADQIVPRMAQTKHIAHRWLHPAFTNQSEVDNLLGQLGNDCVLFHSDHSGTLIDFLRQRKYGIKGLNCAPIFDVSATNELLAKPAVQEQAGNKNPVAVTTGVAIGNVDVYVKTCLADAEWLKYCIRSIRKFVNGIRQVVVITPDIKIVPYAGSLKVKIVEAPEYGNDGYLSQQVFKMYADTFTDSDKICFVDSDTIFTKYVGHNAYFDKQGRFKWMMTPIDQAHPDQEHAWKRVMHKFLGKPPEYEWMRRFPFIVPRWALIAFREFCEKQHGMPLDKYIMSQPYREFTEFNCLGFYLYEYHRDKFEWIDTSKIPESEWPELTVDQRWSHDEIPVKEWEAILALPVSSVEKQPRRDEKTKTLADGHGDNKTPDSDISPVVEETSALPKPVSLTLEQHLEAIAQHFTSPLAKGRIFKRLKSYPITK